MNAEHIIGMHMLVQVVFTVVAGMRIFAKTARLGFLRNQQRRGLKRQELAGLAAKQSF